MNDPTTWDVIPGTTFVCELPMPAKELKSENGCIIAILEDGSKFMVPIEASADTPKN
jgi:hypothetical protein